MANESGSDENLCFFITRIGEEASPDREQADGVMDAIVKPAAEKLGLKCVRADQLPDPGQITTQIIDRIVGAKMVVADLTGGNPNVYYELAVRNSFRLPTALLAQQGERLPFDTSVMRTVFYTPENMKSTAAARDELFAHMKRALKGAVDSPVSTAVDLQQLREGSPVDRQLAELARSVESLSRESQEIKKLISQPTPGVPEQLARDLRAIEAQLLVGAIKDEGVPDPDNIAHLVRSVRERLEPHISETTPSPRALEGFIGVLTALAIANADPSVAAKWRELIQDNHPPNPPTKGTGEGNEPSGQSPQAGGPT